MTNKISEFFKELKRRKVYRVATVYAITSWIIVQIAAVTFPALNVPGWATSMIIILVLIGFPIAIILAWAFEMSPDGIVRTSSSEAKNNPLPAHKRKPFTGTILIVILIVLLAGQFIYFRFIRSTESRTDDNLVEVSLHPQKSIAVLPFKNLSKEEDNLYFSDGVMEAILNNLSRIKDLKVVSRTSVERYRDEKKPIPEIASELEVANILEGSVQRIGNNVRIVVQLISADSDEHIWATHYDRDISDIFTVQSEIAKIIADNLKVILTAEERAIIENAPTTNLKAYDLYLKVLHNKRVYDLRGTTKKDIDKTIEMLREIIAMDETFAMPYANLGESLSKLARFGVPKNIWADSAMAMLDKSLKLNPTNSDAYRYKSQLYKRLKEEDKTKENLLKALQYDPNNFYNIKYLGLYYAGIGELGLGIDYLLKSLAINKPDEEDELINQMNKLFSDIDWKLLKKYYVLAQESNSGSAEIFDWLARTSAFEQHYEEALQYALRVEKVDHERNYTDPIAYFYMLNKQYAKAEDYFGRAMRMDVEQNENREDPWYTPYNGYVKTRLGKTAEGQTIIKAYFDKLLSLSGEYDREMKLNYSICNNLARLNSNENNKEEALAWLEKGVENGSDWYSFMNYLFLISDPFFDNIRAEDRFKMVMKSFSDEDERRSQLLREKLAEYHARKELRWLNVD